MPGGKGAVNGNNPSIRPREAETGFDDLTNGYFEQGPDFDTITEDNVEPLRSYNDGRFVFEEKESVEDGLGPTYNTQSCSACHQNVVNSADSQIAEHRTGHTFNGQFFESPGGSLIQSRATFPDIVEHVLPVDEVRTFRKSNNTMGEGYVECVSDSTLTAIRDDSRPTSRARLLKLLFWKAMAAPGLAGLDGNASTAVCYHLRVMPISTKWASPVLSFRMKYVARPIRWIWLGL